MGRHRSPTPHKGIGKVAAICSSGAFAAVPLTQGTAFAVEDSHPAIHAVPSDDGWDGVAGAISICESGNNPHAHNPHSSASGKYQLIKSTWASVGGLLWAPSAAQATLEQQEIAAHRLYDRDGTSPWDASKPCWRHKVGRVFGTVGRMIGLQPTYEMTGRHRRIGRHRMTQQPQVQPQVQQPQLVQTRYVVKPGDTLYQIGIDHHKRWEDIWEENRSAVQNPSLIHIGLNLNL